MCKVLSKIILILTWMLLTSSCTPAAEIKIQPTVTSTLEPIPTETNVLNVSSPPTSSEECFQSFASFLASPDDFSEAVSRISPLSPWQVESTIPGPVETLPLMLARVYENHQEIWVGHYVYELETKEWREDPSRAVFSTEMGETAVTPDAYFLTRDGSIWGRNDWRSSQATAILPQSVPILSKYNEVSHRFEFAAGVLEIPRDNPDGGWGRPEIVLDSDDIFWIFHTDGKIYRYDPARGQTQKWEAVIPELLIDSAALSPDGSIYLQKARKAHWEHISDGDFLQFFPRTGNVVPLNAPAQSWPVVMYTSMLVDHNGRLWVDALGYREPSGYWRLTHPNLEEYSTNLGNPAWWPAIPYFESSNGILWYFRYTEIPQRDGTAWYDPMTGEGCVFTNIPSKIVEDADHNLWLVADGKLYKYKLEPRP